MHINRLSTLVVRQTFEIRSWLKLTDCLIEILIILSLHLMNFNSKARKRIAFTPIMLSTIQSI